MLIGISGRAESGKTTAAEAIVHYAIQRGLRAKSYELSGYVLRHCIDLGMISPKTRKQLNKEEIAILGQVGESVRETDPSLWAKKALADIAADGPDIAVIPNIRRLYEAQTVRKKSGHIVKITSLNKNGTEFISQTRDPNADLETEQYDIKPDYSLVVPRGESQLLEQMAVTLFDYLWVQKKPVQKMESAQLELAI